jgi:plastocyanin
MSKKLAALSIALAAVALAACGGRYGSDGTGNVAADGATSALPGTPALQITVTLPNGKTGTIMEELPSEGIGTVNDAYWSATLGGFTQEQYAQALGFPPGTTLTIKNISSSFHHTLNVIEKISGPPANFPSNPNLSTSPHGKSIKVGYATGSINPGSSVTVKAKAPGIYLIGCAFHYSLGMKDVLVIANGATPGPQGTPPAQ